MPHILVKMVVGHPTAAREALSDRIAAAVTEALGSTADEVSVAIEEVPSADWMTAVYAPEIAAYPELLVKRPGYGSLASQGITTEITRSPASRRDACPA